MNAKIEKHLEELDRLIISLLSPGSIAPFKPLLWINYHLKQRNLHDIFDAKEILSEAYLRTRKSIENGEKIDDYIAWLRHTCFLIVLEKRTELSREKVRIERIAKTSLSAEIQPDQEAEPAFSNDQNKSILKQALTYLTPQENQLINSRFVNGLSWTDIQNNTDETASLAALRKRGQRAFGRLKDAFYSIKNKKGGDHEY